MPPTTIQDYRILTNRQKSDGLRLACDVARKVARMYIKCYDEDDEVCPGSVALACIDAAQALLTTRHYELFKDPDAKAQVENAWKLLGRALGLWPKS